MVNLWDYIGKTVSIALNKSWPDGTNLVEGRVTNCAPSGDNECGQVSISLWDDDFLFEVYEDEIESIRVIADADAGKKDKFDVYFDFLQGEARKQGAKFFMDSGEGTEFETEDMEGEVLSGWLIPLDKADEFFQEWSGQKASEPHSSIYDNCLGRYVFANWELSDGKISVTFKAAEDYFDD